MPTPNRGRSRHTPLAPAEEDLGIETEEVVSWFNRPLALWTLQICAILSLVSVSCNTPKTFEDVPALMWITLAIDIVISALYTAEMALKMKSRGILKENVRGEIAYLRDHWCRFDMVMVIFLWASVILQALECEGTAPGSNSYRSIIRSPRPLVVVRLFRVFLNVKLPKTRINQIFKRSSQQIYNVTLFFLFFMSLYAILGVQFFGDLKYHCVRDAANGTMYYTNDLAIPDAFCSYKNNSGYGHKCPDGMKCVAINGKDGDALPRNVTGYTTFVNFAFSFFSVYNAASQEGWSNVMYQAIDILASWKAYLYFISLIFFLAWLVKNVFIAVIIETFAEIRVQFQQMWGSHDTTADSDPSLMLEAECDGKWKLVSVDEKKPPGLAPATMQRIVRSPAFNAGTLVLVLLDACVSASRSFDHKSNRLASDVAGDPLYYTQVACTLLFNVEVLLKMWCLWPRGYLRRSQHKLEFALAVGTTVHIIPYFYRGFFSYFQVLRVVRLIKASPMLEDFCWKIFGPGKKLGSLVLFTTCLLIITSSVSLQLFCFLYDKDNYELFQDFPHAFMSVFIVLAQDGWTTVMTETMKQMHGVSGGGGVVFVAIYFVIIHLSMVAAFMSMFQILLKKGWTDIMHKTLWVTGEEVAAFVAIYFICYHLLVTVIILSLFVAVILDNLELEEDIKKLKQLKAREMSTKQQQKLPLRLRVFEKFPNQPQMVKVSKQISSNFVTPSIRESFMKNFVEHESACGVAATTRHRALSEAGGGADSPSSSIGLPPRCGELLCNAATVHSDKTRNKKVEVTAIIYESSLQRTLNSSEALAATGPLPATKSLLSSQSQVRTERRGTRRSQAHGFVRSASMRPSSVTTMPRQNGDASGGVTSAQTRMRRQPTDRDNIDIQILQQKKQQAEIKRSQQEEELKENHPLFDTPLFAVSRESRFRHICHLIVSARYMRRSHDPFTGKELKSKYKHIHKLIGLVPLLDWFMIFMTIVSCAAMMFETPTDRVMDPQNIYLQIPEYLFVTSMSVEVLLKVFANGLLFTPNAVIRDFGGALDMFIYLVSFVFVVTMVMVQQETIANFSLAHFVMILRCLRPLRIFILVPHIRKVVYELVRGFKEIMLVSVLLIVLMFIFASYGVQNYGGKLAKCNDRSRTERANCTGIFLREVQVTKMQLKNNGTAPSLYVPRVWANPRNFNFDNIGSAMLALFEVLSLEGWLDIRDVLNDRVPSDETIYASIYVHVFVFIGVLIGLTLFVGVVVANYSENKGTALLTVDQRRWLDLKGRINLTQPLHIPPRPENSRLRAAIFDMTQSRMFKRTVACLVLINSALLVVPWYEEEGKQEWTDYLTIAATLFIVLFTLEVTMKLIALSPKGYWYSRRNRLDLLVTCFGIVWVIVYFTVDDTHREIADALGTLVIILRFFTITGKHATLKMLMLTIVVSMVKSFFLITGMFLLMLFYAYAGVLMFGSVRYGESLNRHANFRSAPQAIVLLLRIVTGEDWNKIMHDCMIGEPYCTTNASYWETDCGNFYASLAYFCSFYVIITYIVLNLLVAIIMENFSLFYSNEEDALLSYSDIRHYHNTWNAVDFHRRGCIAVKHVPFLLRLLDGRLHIDLDRDVLLFRHMCYEVQYLHGGANGEATFHDILTMLSYRSVDIHKSLQLEELLAREELEYTIEEEVAKQTIITWLNKCIKKFRAKGHADLVRKGVQEPFFLVTEATESSFDDFRDTLPAVLAVSFHPDISSKPMLSRNASEPLQLQLPRRGAGSAAGGAYAESAPRAERKISSQRPILGKQWSITALSSAAPSANDAPSSCGTELPSSASVPSATAKKVVTAASRTAQRDVKRWWREQLLFEHEGN